MNTSGSRHPLHNLGTKPSTHHRQARSDVTYSCGRPRCTGSLFRCESASRLTLPTRIDESRTCSNCEESTQSMSKYLYFPSQYDGSIRSLLLDANVVGHLDTISRRGSSFDEKNVQNRVADLVARLSENVFVMPGLGAAESLMRRKPGIREASNYSRRSANAMRLLVDNRRSLQAWSQGSDVLPDPQHPNDGESGNGVPEADLRIVRENLILPSYAMVLKAYQLFLERRDPLVAFGSLALFAAELFGRGSREVTLGALLLAGNSPGREMALNIMKLRQEKCLDSTLDALWNTSFDLTYSRIATMPSLPELRGLIPQPAVFVTDDKHLGKFLALVQPVGAMSHNHGAGLTADLVTFENLVSENLADGVAQIVSRGNAEASSETTDLELIGRIRRYKSRQYIQQLESWFADRYPESSLGTTSGD